MLQRPHNRFLRLAALSAMRAVGNAEPNPLVGCVIERDGAVLGIGHHRRFGDLHAERAALANCAAHGRDPNGATAHVTLEPCCHTGKQPPCTEALIAAGIKRVVFARSDPGELSKGGAEILRAAGIDAVADESDPVAFALSSPFVHHQLTGRPWVIAKWAQTVDGRIATRSGQSQWISNDLSRNRVHRLRSRVDAILSALGTVIADDPQLTARGLRRTRRTPTRVVVDQHLDIALDRALITSAHDVPTLIACDDAMATSDLTKDKRTQLEARGVTILGVNSGPQSLERMDLRNLLTLLGERGICTVMVEAGPGLLGSLFEADLVDEAWVYIAPLLLGDEQAPGAARGRAVPTLAQDGGSRPLRLVHTRRLGDDVELWYRRGEV